MATKEKKPRNRSAEALAKGRTLTAFELQPETVSAIERAAEYLTSRQEPGTRARATRVQALEWLVQQGVKKLPK